MNWLISPDTGESSGTNTLSPGDKGTNYGDLQVQVDVGNKDCLMLIVILNAATQFLKKKIRIVITVMSFPLPYSSSSSRVSMIVRRLKSVIN